MVWLLADVLLPFFTVAYEVVTGTSNSEGFDVSWAVFFYSLIFTIPSLLIIFIFNNWFLKEERSGYITAFSVVIILINLLYLIVTVVFMERSLGTFLFYTATTISGLSALYIVSAFIKFRSFQNNNSE